MIDTQAIRNKILDLAMHGQLTEQGSSDVSAHKLVAELSNTLKGLPFQYDIDPHDIPYEIPESWVWCHLSDIGTTNIGLTYHPEDVSTNGTIVARSSNIVNGKMDYTDLVKVTCPIRDNQFLSTNDILICARNGSKALVGKCAIFEGAPKTVAFGAFMAVFRTPLYRYVYYYFNTQVFKRNFFNDESKQINQVTQSILKQSLIPVPPMQEQERITEKIEQVFSALDIIDELQAQYTDNLSVLKSKLIDAAIQGKLTEQLPEDGTAEELYQQIQAEKHQLIKEGKIKKSRPLPEITEDEIPFDIPDNWKWAYLGELFQHNTGKALNSSDSQGKKLEYITTSNLYWDRFELDNLKTMLFTDSEIEKCTVKKGDLLVCEGGDIGRSAIWSTDNKMLIQNHIHRLRSYGNYICVRFFYYVMCLYKHTGRINGIGIGLQGLSSKRLHSLVIPLPPLAEQKRIVQKLDEILPLCDNLK